MTSQRLARRDAGEAGPRIVLLHGLLGRGRNLATAAAHLAEHGYRATMLDLPDHGRSPWTAEGEQMDLASLALTVAAELDAIAQEDGGEPVHLLGHSLGGKASMQVALRRPELVASLVVVDIAPVDYGDSSASEHTGHLRAMRGLDLASLASRGDADRLMAAEVDDPRVRGFLLQNLARRGDGWGWDANLDLLARDLMAVAAFPLEGTTPYPGQALFLAGADSGYVRDDHRDEITRLFPHSRVVRVKGSGHWVHSEQPELFVELVRRFLDDRATA